MQKNRCTLSRPSCQSSPSDWSFSRASTKNSSLEKILSHWHPHSVLINLLPMLSILILAYNLLLDTVNCSGFENKFRGRNLCQVQMFVGIYEIFWVNNWQQDLILNLKNMSVYNRSSYLFPHSCCLYSIVTCGGLDKFYWNIMN